MALISSRSTQPGATVSPGADTAKLPVDENLSNVLAAAPAGVAESAPVVGSRPLLSVALLVAWVACGVMTAYAMKRRGHEVRPWIGMGIGLGPLLIPLARLDIRDRESSVQAHALSEGDQGPGPIHLVVGLMGPAETISDVIPMIELVGSGLGKLTICSAIDYQSAESDEWQATKASSLVELELAAALLGERWNPATVMVPGAPPHSFFRFAAATGHHLVALVGWSGSLRVSRQSDLPVTVLLPSVPGQG
ncbi:MAG TPA: hypothetical protein VLA91_02720 [Acidimicrobiia bacterium]|nr:hypothetical protein [Acidimicrobiia bacterium]